MTPLLRDLRSGLLAARHHHQGSRTTPSPSLEEGHVELPPQKPGSDSAHDGTQKKIQHHIGAARFGHPSSLGHLVSHRQPGTEVQP